MISETSMIIDIANEPMLWREPKRITGFSGWRGHLPFAMWLMPYLRPRIFVELGTHTGDSYCAFCQSAQENAMDEETQCFAVDTWEGDEHAGFYQEPVWEDICSYHNQAGYGNFSQLVRARFEESVHQFADKSIDLLHIDGLHTYDAVRSDYETYLPKLSDRAVVLFHDTAVHENGFEVYRFWDEISKNKPHFSWQHSNGLGVLAPGGVPPEMAKWFDATPEQMDSLRTIFTHLGERWRLVGDLAHAEARIAADDEGITWLREQNTNIQKLETEYKMLEARFTDLESEARRIWQERTDFANELEKLRK